MKESLELDDNNSENYKPLNKKVQIKIVNFLMILIRIDSQDKKKQAASEEPSAFVGPRLLRKAYVPGDQNESVSINTYPDRSTIRKKENIIQNSK